jgi:hypothetical protein
MTHKPPAAAILVVPLVVALVLTVFAWPNSRLEPRDLPVGVAGPAPAAHAIETKLSEQEGAFRVERYADESAAREAIEDREVYGAFVATASGPKVLTGSAASPVVAQLLSHAAAEQHAEVEDVVSTPKAGSALGSSVLPMVLAGILTGVLAALAGSNGRARAGLVLAGSVLGGLSATLVVDSWLGVVEGDWLANAGVLTLTVLAIASAMAGLYALFGRHGLGLGAAAMILVGNPFSAAAAAPELLPQPVGGIGQLMPPGAGANLLRSTGFFDGAGAGEHLAVLAIWALAGLTALLAAPMRRTLRARWTRSMPQVTGSPTT